MIACNLPDGREGRIFVMLQNTPAEHLFTDVLSGRNEISTTDGLTGGSAVETNGYASVLSLDDVPVVEGPVIAHFAGKSDGGWPV